MQEVKLGKVEKKIPKFLNNIFLVGSFLLPSAFTLGTGFLLISVIYGVYNSRGYFKDKLNIIFFVAGIFLIISAFIHSNFNDYLSNYNINHSLSWIGLANWIPFFLCFWGFQPYLNSKTKRRRTAFALLAGTLPVIITGIGQSFFKWYGPIETLNGLIVWYQRPIEGITGIGQSFFNWYGPIETLNGLIVWYQRPIDGITGMTGLFNNPNYTGLWLNLILPFCLAETINSRSNKLDRIITFIFSFSFALCTILTNSRAAWICIVLGSVVIFGRKGLKLIFPLIISISLIISSSIYPIFGTGGGSFPEIYMYETGLWKGHAHNLPLELFLSYGIPAGIIILLPIIYLFIFSTKTIFFNKLIKISIFDKAWVISIMLFLFSQLVDVQYFDGRISILFWILLAGAKNIIDEDKLPINFIKGK